MATAGWYAQRRAEHMARVQAIKIERGCADCGYDRCAEALDFDHLPGAEKIKPVSRLVGMHSRWATIEAEIAKCDVVCANCHRERTSSRRVA